MTNPTAGNADIEDLVDAIIDAGASPPGCDGHYSYLRDALLELLTERFIDTAPRDADSLDDLLQTALQSKPRVLNAFSGYLEAPSSVITLYQRHSKLIETSAAQARAAFRSLVLDIVVLQTLAERTGTEPHE